MNCPRCGTTICLCDSCKRIDNLLNENKDTELFICKNCRLVRPFAWWDALQLDVNTEMKLEEENLIEEDMWPEEFCGHCESPWSD